MARNSNNRDNNDNSVKELWEKHPISFYLGSMVAVAVAISSILIYYFTNRIEDMKFAYEQQINNLKENHQRDIEMAKMKAVQETQESAYISIDSNSNSGIELKELLKHYSPKK